MSLPNPRGSALVAALIVVVGISLLSLSLLMKTTQLTLGRSEASRQRALASADHGWLLAFERLSRSPLSPSLQLRHLALHRSERNREALSARWFETADSGMPVEISQPRFVALHRPMGSDLRSFNQEGLFVERYEFTSIAGRERLKEPARIEFELETAPVVSEALSLPEPRRR